MGFDWEEILGVEDGDDLATAYENHVAFGEDVMDFEGDSNFTIEKEHVSGHWRGEKIRFKRVWDDHWFTEGEIIALLNDQEIRFRHTLKGNSEQDIVGKLAEQEYKGSKFIGFAPSNWNK